MTSTAGPNPTHPKPNAAQARAVAHLDGPMLVLAGPGTGKTTLLTARIAHLLQHHPAGVDPERILCLTFTDAGAGAMRRKLTELLGPVGNQVQVRTFHAFTNGLIQADPTGFGREDLQPLSELERVQVLRKLVEELPTQHRLKRLGGKLHYEVKPLGRFFELMKKEGWTPEHVINEVDAAIAAMPTLPDYIYSKKATRGGVEFKKGDLKAHLIAKDTRKLEKTRAAAELYSAYEDALRKLGRYEFADMINWVNRRFAEDADFSHSVQERYDYVLVDEYQDTNGSQNQLIFNLVAFWEDNPNLFVVGDDDQAIYGFQGADFNRLQDLFHRYKTQLEAVVLTENYRSTQVILDHARAIIQPAQKRLIYLPEFQEKFSGLHKDLHAARDAELQPAPMPRIREYPNALLEAQGIALEIEALVNDQKVPPNRIAVLYRNHKHSEDLLRGLRALGIPTRQTRSQDVLKLPEFEPLFALLQFVAAEAASPGRGKDYLPVVLKAPWWGLAPETLPFLQLQFALKVGKYRTAEQPVAYPDFRRELTAVYPSELLPGSELARLRKINALLTNWTHSLGQQHLLVWLDHLAAESGLLNWAAEQTPPSFLVLEAYRSLRTFVQEEVLRQFRPPKRPGASAQHLQLQHLLETLAAMEDAQVRLPAQQVLGEAHGVQFSTAHGAKGLEFEHVFLMGATAENWNGKGPGGNGYTLPEGLGGEDTTDASEDERRLFYVALTRAERGLYVSFNREKSGNNSSNPASFLVELRAEREANGLPVDWVELLEPTEPPSETAKFLASTLAPPAPIQTATGGQLQELLQGYRLSPSSLNTYLTDPQAFYQQEILRVPSPSESYMLAGKLMHKALEEAFQLANKNGALPTAEFIGARFLAGIEDNRPLFTPAEYNVYQTWGEEIVPEYVAQAQPHWHLPASVEVRFNDLEIAGVPVKGVIDKLEETPEGYYLIDYKTGRPPSNNAKLKPANKKGLGGDYWRQLVFYALLVEADPRYPKPVLGAFLEYILPAEMPDMTGSRFRRYSVELTPEARETVRNQLADAWASISAGEFPAKK